MFSNHLKLKLRSRLILMSLVIYVGFCDVFQESRPRHTDSDPPVGVAVRLVSPASGEGLRSAAGLSVHIGVCNVIPGKVTS